MSEENGIVQSTGGKAAKRPSRRKIGQVSNHPLSEAAAKAERDMAALQNVVYEGRNQFIEAKAYETAEMISQTSNVFLERLGEVIEEVVEEDPEAFRQEGQRIVTILFPLG
jgi:hypothetical protein